MKTFLYEFRMYLAEKLLYFAYKVASNEKSGLHLKNAVLKYFKKAKNEYKL